MLTPLSVSEHLFELFGEYGEINSVKVMWPRTDEGTNTPFLNDLFTPLLLLHSCFCRFLLFYYSTLPYTHTDFSSYLHRASAEA